MNGILAFGDSIVKGIHIENEKYCVNPNRFTNLLEARLNVPIENKSQMGSTIMRLEKSMQRALPFLENPDYDTILLSYGGNDSDYDWQAISDNPLSEHVPFTSLNLFHQEYVRKINELKKLGKDIYLLSLPPIDANKYFNWVSKDRNAEAILSWLHGDITYLAYWHETYNLEVFKIAMEANVPVIDITTCFLLNKDYSSYLCADGIHPNTKGHELIASVLITNLLQ